MTTHVNVSGGLEMIRERINQNKIDQPPSANVYAAASNQDRKTSISSHNYNSNKFNTNRYNKSSSLSGYGQTTDASSKFSKLQPLRAEGKLTNPNYSNQIYDNPKENKGMYQNSSIPSIYEGARLKKKP